MDKLLEENKNCADCGDLNVEDANMDKGVTLCAACGQMHQKVFKTPTRKLTELNDEEIGYLNSKGNAKSNSALLKTQMPWTVTLKNTNSQQEVSRLVREWMIEAKYIKSAFAKEQAKKKVTYDFTDMWYYLDEVSREKPWVKGPYRRQAIRKMLDEQKVLFRDSFVWHQVLGSKWMIVEKVYDIICPPPNLTESSIQEACLRKLRLQSLPHPHLRGFLEVNLLGTHIKKWAIILHKHIEIYSNPVSQDLEKRINFEEINGISLQEQNSRLYISIEEAEGTIIFGATKTDEVIEWYHAITCCQHLIYALGGDFPELDVDASELFICNVKSSNEFIGDKVYEGFLKKQGLKWKNTRQRWFVLRNGALFYYKYKTDKHYKKMLRINGASTLDWKLEYKHQFHFSFKNNERTLHMWAENAAEKEVWIEKLDFAITKMKLIEDERIGGSYS